MKIKIRFCRQARKNATWCTQNEN